MGKSGGASRSKPAAFAATVATPKESAASAATPKESASSAATQPKPSRRSNTPERLSQRVSGSELAGAAISRAQFTPNELARINERADQLYRSAQASRRTAEVMGGLRPIHDATQEQVRQHFQYVEALGRVNRTSADPQRYAINMSPEEIARDVESRAAARRRGAGARAVQRKYGEKAAYNITGHHIKR